MQSSNNVYMTIQFFAVKLEDDLQHTAPIDGIMPFAYWLLTLACLADFYLCFFCAGSTCRDCMHMFSGSGQMIPVASPQAC